MHQLESYNKRRIQIWSKANEIANTDSGTKYIV